MTDNTVNNFSTTKHGFVPKGTNVGNFLKDDGSWAAASSPSAYNGTVGIGGTYADIQAAITGIGGTDFRLLLLSNVTEDSDVAIPSGANLVINLSSFTLTMAAYQFTYSAVANVFVYGNGVDSGAEIDWTQTTSGKQLFENASYPTSTVRMENILLDNNSTQNSTYVSDGIEKINNVRIELANKQFSGFYSQLTSTLLCEYTNIDVVGGGSSCDGAINCNGRLIANNIYFSGTFKTNSLVFELIRVSELNNIYSSSSNTININVNISGGSSSISNVYGKIKIDLTNGTRTKLMNFDLDGAILDIEGVDNAIICNGLCGTLDLSDTSASNNLISNVIIESGATTVAGDNNSISNCTFRNNVTVNNGADNNGFVGCTMGTDAGGSAYTLTINASAIGTRVVACKTDVAIVDNGSGTELHGNTIY